LPLKVKEWKAQSKKKKQQFTKERTTQLQKINQLMKFDLKNNKWNNNSNNNEKGILGLFGNLKNASIGFFEQKIIEKTFQGKQKRNF
jgi:hypothetical protein